MKILEFFTKALFVVHNIKTSLETGVCHASRIIHVICHFIVALMSRMTAAVGEPWREQKDTKLPITLTRNLCKW